VRVIQRHPAARAVMALLVGGALSWIVWRAGLDAVALVLFSLLAAAVYVVLTIAPDAIALRRGHHWPWWWRHSGDEGPFWPGTRIPRQPRRPR